jgi:hypothetical protein
MHPIIILPSHNYERAFLVHDHHDRTTAIQPYEISEI